MKRLRRVLLELWAMLPVAAVVGFLGPFGTYLSGDFLLRAGRWWIMLMGAYILARPTLIAWRAIARATRLPRGSLVFWGMVASSFPMALIWRLVGRDEVRLLGGYAGLLPFTLLCCLLVMTIAWWAERADAHLLRYYDEHMGPTTVFASAREGAVPMDAPVKEADVRLHRRLSPAFAGPIVALESEDHYVRVHGAGGSELLLMRLRDAIAEMEGVAGAQVHRSWWIAHRAILRCDPAGRSWLITLDGGLSVPVARDSVARLQRAGFLPAS